MRKYLFMATALVVAACTKEGDTIYDPFMGTGTTAIACIREKRNYVGSELSPRYIDWAEKRINREHQQLSLF